MGGEGGSALKWKRRAYSWGSMTERPAACDAAHRVKRRSVLKARSARLRQFQGWSMSMMPRRYSPGPCAVRAEEEWGPSCYPATLLPCYPATLLRRPRACSVCAEKEWGPSCLAPSERSTAEVLGAHRGRGGRAEGSTSA